MLKTPAGFLLKHDEEQTAQRDANPQSTKVKLNMFCAFADPYCTNKACCRKRMPRQSNLGVLLVEVEGLGANVALKICDDLLHVNSIRDGDGIQLNFC